MKQYIGIILNSNVYRGIETGKTKREMISYYEEAAKQYHLTPCYFRLADIRMNSQTIQAFVYKSNTLRKHTVPLPQVIHNRAIHQNTKYVAKIQRLNRKGIQIFNNWNRYKKLYIYHLLMQDITMRPHLPCTIEASEDSTKLMMGMFSSLIIKPNIGSIGRGILKLEQKDNLWRLHYQKSNKSRAWGCMEFKNQLPRMLVRKLQLNDYIVQQQLPLATVADRPFDMRVSVQKSNVGNWKVIGIACKVAAKHKFVTNVAQGGSVYTLDYLLRKLPHLDPAQVKHDVEHFSLRVAHHLSLALPHLADIGLDIGITEHGYPVFIECNNRDLRYSFQKAGMLEEWKASYHNPIGYAHYLLQNKNHTKKQ